MKSQKAAPRGDNLRLYFIVCIFAILCVTLGVSALLTLLLEWLTNTRFTVPTIVWMVLFSVVLGGGLSIIMSRFFLRPVTRLGRAMERVAAGDFTVRLDNPGALGEMRDSYAHFNTMTRALAATETLQSDFISNVSHEFKTPINAIEGYAMLMQDAGNDPALQREYADKILLSTRRLSELVNNILLLSKVDNQTVPLEKHPYRLDEQLRRAILLLERKWTQKQIEWDVDMDEATYTGSESLMLHVWVNLLDNAIKFDPVGGEIRLRLRCEPAHIRIDISDNGPGIPEDQQSAIFERFYQASQPQPVPSELAALPHPIFGFVGALQPCIEYGFVEHAAKAHPEWSFVWIGGEKPGADVSALKALPNCHFLGIKPNEQLPQYLAHFDVCLNLFASGPLSKDVSPLKFYEYLATGKPIVSTRQPDQILQYAPLIHIADTADEFVEKCAEARSDTQPERVRARIEEGRKSSWDARVEQMCEILRSEKIL